MINGLLLIDKPSGWTSFDVVAKIRSIISHAEAKRVKVGHSGTLDPFATGLLQIFIGSYTKRVQEFTKMDKVYEVVMRLGQSSSTGDPEGALTNISDRIPENFEIIEALNKFTGEYMQSPPIFSAIKIGGKKAYELARKGEEVKLEKRLVKVYNLQFIDYSYPEIVFSVSVSSGTYIRSLVVDIGEYLGTGAYTIKLRRSSIGDFNVSDSIKIENCSFAEIKQNLIKLE
jgi:tRNA pseudouridine55 synthase